MDPNKIKRRKDASQPQYNGTAMVSKLGLYVNVQGPWITYIYVRTALVQPNKWCRKQLVYASLSLI